MECLVSLSLDNSKPPSFFFALINSQLNRLSQVNQCQAISFQSNDHMRHHQSVVEDLLALFHKFSFLFSKIMGVSSMIKCMFSILNLFILFNLLSRNFFFFKIEKT